jgi:hypothetical protein
MAESPTAAANGTETPTVGTEATLFQSSSAGVFSFHVDTVNMAAGDVLQLRIYQMILTGGTTRVAYFQQYTDAQAANDLIKISVPIANDISDTGAITCTLKQTAGTARAFPYKVLQY